MLRLARVQLRKRTARRHTPAGIAALPSPQLKRGWGDLTRLDARQKQELLHGDWRQAKSVQLAPDEADRDRGGYTAGKVAFVSDEAAEQFLAQESADDAEEAQVPSLSLAQQFFVDLAVTADEELDLLQDAGTSPDADAARRRGGLTPAEARRDEAEDVQRHFFSAYYTDHGLLGPGDDPFAFVDATLTPSPALFEVNGEHPLARLTVRDQLEAHVGQSPCVFASAPDGDPLTYSLASVPTQPYGAPLRLPYTAETSFIARQEAAAAAAAMRLPDALEAPPRAALPAAPSTEDAEMGEADALAAWLNGDTDDVRAVETAPLEVPLSSAPLSVPPSLAHTQWLQRQVATDALVPVDVLGRVLTMVATRWAYPAAVPLEGSSHPHPRRDDNDDAPPPLILDLFGANARQRTDVYRDMARFLYRVVAQDEGNAATQGHTARLPCLAVCVPVSPSHAPKDTHHGASQRTHAAASELPDRVSAGLSADLPVADQSPFILYVQAAASTRGRHGSARRPKTVENAFERACDVVLCAPVTSEDGRRPRTILGDESQMDSDAHPPAANNFIAVCTRARELFPKLVWQLSLALQQYARDGGLVLYATYSMNPLENEAVVAAAIRQAEKDGGCRVTCLALNGESLLLSTCEPEERHVLAALLTHGQHGLVSWASVDGADPRHEAEASSLALREAIASAAWRLRPDRDPCDGGFLVALRVHREARVPESARRGLPHATPAVSSPSSAYCLSPPPAREPTTDGSVPLHLLTHACHWWWQAAAHGTHAYWSCLSGGVAVGLVHVDPATQGASYRHLALSSSINNWDYGYHIAQLNSRAPFGALNEVRVPVPLLSELLRCRVVRGDSLVEALEKQESSFDLQVFAQALLTVMTAHCLRVQQNGWQHLSLLLAPTCEFRDGAAPHEALADELQHVRVAMRLRFRRHPRSHDETSRCPFTFSLALSVPQALPGRRLHLEASHEASAGLQDALHYVMRRCGLEAAVRLSHTAETPEETMPEADDDGPQGNGGVELADDEFDVEDGDGPPTELLSFHEQSTRSRRLNALEKRMRTAGLGEDAPTSWASSIHYGSARRTGRG